MGSQPKRKKVEDWPISTGIGRGFAEQVANDYLFSSSKVRLNCRKQFMQWFKLEIATGFLRATSYNDMDEFRIGMADTLGWDWEDATGWRKLTGFGKKGAKGPKNPIPSFDDVIMYFVVEKRWHDPSFNNCMLSAIRSSILDISRHMDKVDSMRHSKSICDRIDINTNDVACLRYSYGHPKLLRVGFKPSPSFEIHIKANIGIYYPGKSVGSMLADLRDLAGTWLEPWALMELSLPYRWVQWGYHKSETKYEI